MLKKSISLLLSVAICVCMGTTAFAATNTPTPDSEMTSSELVEYLNSVDFGSDVTFTELPTTRSGNNELLHFDSVEEVETYFQQLFEERQEFRQAMESTPVSETHSLNLTRASNGWKEGTVYWWGGGNTSLLSLTNAVIRHYYRNGQISNITVKDSYMTGIVGATWTHRSGKGTPLGGRSAKFSVTGTWFIGLDILGFPVGASFNETLNSPTINITVN